MNGNDKKAPNGVNLRERKLMKQEEDIQEGSAEENQVENEKSKKTFGKTPDGTGE